MEDEKDMKESLKALADTRFDKKTKEALAHLLGRNTSEENRLGYLIMAIDNDSLMGKTNWKLDMTQLLVITEKLAEQVSDNVEAIEKTIKTSTKRVKDRLESCRKKGKKATSPNYIG